MKTSIITCSIALAAIAVAIVFSSCAGITSGLTGQPIPSTPVQRDGGLPFSVATSDVYRAEAEPLTVWGLYNAGRVAGAIQNGSK